MLQLFSLRVLAVVHSPAMATLSRLMAARLVTPSFTEEEPDFEAILTPLLRRQQFDPASYASGDGFGDSQSKPHPLCLGMLRSNS